MNVGGSDLQRVIVEAAYHKHMLEHKSLHKFRSIEIIESKFLTTMDN